MRTIFFFLAYSTLAISADLAIVTDHTNYNAGSTVQIRLEPPMQGTVSIRYAGESAPLVANRPVTGPLWTIPRDARTGRYAMDFRPERGGQLRDVGSFAVHRQLVKILSLELDKTFYTSGDSVNPRIVVANLSDRQLSDLQVEFEGYTFPWIAPAPDEPPAWKHVITDSLSLSPGGEKEFRVEKAAVVQAGKEPVAIYYCAVIRDRRNPDHIYDLAFAPAAFTSPVETRLPKAYPFLYNYTHLHDVSNSEAYRQFYPPEFVSDVIRFDTKHTMFGAESQPTFSFTINGLHWVDPAIIARVLDASGRELETQTLGGAATGEHQVRVKARPPGLYVLEVSVQVANKVAVARNRLEFAVNRLPKSILIFCAHQDDDTAHPGIIRAAVENDIPIHIVYFTGGDGGGCDRFYMHSCDAERAMDFGEVRMEESVASLAHLGIPRENISFLGLPDGGLEQIWFHNAKAESPYLSVLLASDHTPFRQAAVPNLPFALEPILAATEKFITEFKPDMIITGHPDERHVDHRTNNWIVVKAMQKLLRDGLISRDVQLVVDSVYGAAPQKPAPYRYEKQLLHVSGEVARLGQEATWFYQSQDGNHQQARLVTYDKLSREEPYPHFRILDWPDHEGWNEHR